MHVKHNFASFQFRKNGPVSLLSFSFFKAESTFTIAIFYEWSVVGYANEGDWERDGGWGISDISHPVRLPLRLETNTQMWLKTKRKCPCNRRSVFFFFLLVCFFWATHKQKIRELAAERVFIKGVTSGRAGVSKLRCNRGLLSRFRSFQKMFPTHPRLFPSSSSHSPLLSLLPSQAWSLHRGGGPKNPLRQHCQCITSQHHQTANPTNWA